jgi:hypothetical protein
MQFIPPGVALVILLVIIFGLYHIIFGLYHIIFGLYHIKFVPTARATATQKIVGEICGGMSPDQQEALRLWAWAVRDGWNAVRVDEASFPHIYSRIANENRD